MIIGGKDMHQKDIERLAFLFLCGKHDKAVLSGKKEMTFADLERLMYITDYLGLHEYNRTLFLEYYERFEEKFHQLELAGKESRESGQEEGYPEADVEKYEKWLIEFMEQVADEDIKKKLVKLK